MVHAGSIIIELRNLLNDNLIDVYKDTRAGSFVFGPDHEINFKKYMPKVQVISDSTDSVKDSFGAPFKREKNYTIYVTFFTKEGDTGSENSNSIKNKELVHYYMEEVEKVVGSNLGSISASLSTFGETPEPTYNADHSVFIGIKPLIFKNIE